METNNNDKNSEIVGTTTMPTYETLAAVIDELRQAISNYKSNCIDARSRNESAINARYPDFSLWAKDISDLKTKMASLDTKSIDNLRRDVDRWDHDIAAIKGKIDKIDETSIDKLRADMLQQNQVMAEITAHLNHHTLDQLSLTVSEMNNDVQTIKAWQPSCIVTDDTSAKAISNALMTLFMNDQLKVLLNLAHDIDDAHFSIPSLNQEIEDLKLKINTGGDASSNINENVLDDYVKADDSVHAANYTTILKTLWKDATFTKLVLLIDRVASLEAKNEKNTADIKLLQNRLSQLEKNSSNDISTDSDDSSHDRGPDVVSPDERVRE